MKDSLGLQLLLPGVASLVAAIIYVLLIAPGSRSLRHTFRTAQMRRLLPLFLAALTGMLGLVVAIIGLPDKTLVKTRSMAVNEEMARLQEKIGNLDKTFETTKKAYTALQSPSAKGVPMAEIQKLSSRVTNAETAIKKFEDLMLTDAEKLITLPLLKAELQTLQKDISSVKDQVSAQGRLFQEFLNQTRWVLGTIGFGILALIFPIARTAFSTKKKETD